MLKNIAIYRSQSNKWITGVCAGIADRLGVNPMWVRLAAIIVAIAPAGLGIPPMVVVYVVLTVLLPEKSAADPFSPPDTTHTF